MPGNKSIPFPATLIVDAAPHRGPAGGMEPFRSRSPINLRAGATPVKGAMDRRFEPTPPGNTLLTA